MFAGGLTDDFKLARSSKFEPEKSLSFSTYYLSVKYDAIGCCSLKILSSERKAIDRDFSCTFRCQNDDAIDLLGS
ncbi:MAG: hypothetical protein F6K28_35950 [Microcoleus sp. SIO2G3]|nr:hypothetical protein [Microcoleus sp. SIO2G3]